MHRADLNSANALGRNPLFPLDESCECLDLDATTLDFEVPRFNEVLESRLTNSQVLSKTLRDNFATLKILTALHAEIGRKGKVKPAESIRCSDELYLTERS